MGQQKKLLLSEMREAQRDYMSSIDVPSAYQTSLADKIGKTIEKKAAMSIIIIAVLIGIVTFTNGLMGFLIIRSITGPVGKATNLAGNMAKGGFTDTIKADQHDGQIAQRHGRPTDRHDSRNHKGSKPYDQ